MLNAPYHIRAQGKPGSIASEDQVRRGAIRHLNEAFRKGERPDLGHTIITDGVCRLAALSGADIEAVLERVRSFEAKANDPLDEHDFGLFQHAGAIIVWKIEPYDEKLKYGSQDPSNPHITTRVLTIMLAEEY